MKRNQNTKNRKVEIDGNYLLEKTIFLEDEIERLENKAYKTIEDKNKLKEYRKLSAIISPEVDRIINEQMKKPGAYEGLYYFVKELAEQGDKQAKKDLITMTPKFHKYLEGKNNMN